ncbi:M20 aminoacylase family protein [Sinorhizobium americanum]|uniref:Metal-dependent amidase/aminoacylase/carboxypeptidase n=1 Tax=Sinorhizobium americanum TaxID=194963 RepID=A0A1L3LYL7_9HYPH|nr:M20 aminoacylase family protein [Sinorhizobium americanum]APG95113.1 metal-dependent amidase/aminoacylase/carboxypeptidase [Sinorhizobium americanum]OAP43172.1 amidohydrolase [Sinorhizobium americanum]
MNAITKNAQFINDVEQGIAAYIEEMIELRHDLHRYPELAFKESRTSDVVAGLLAGWGYDVARGIAGTGVVATLQRREGTRSIGIRADMDALPINEATNLSYASRNPGVMHACGHDGHTAILLTAARYLAENGHFSGTLRLIFQPAEEIGAGARKMLSEGLLERFPVDAVFGLHNWPGVAVGQFGFVTGPAMASVDQAVIRIIGKGGHGAEPQNAVDPVVAAASFITALQTVVSRNIDPREMAVVTVGSIHGGSASNVIPEKVEIKLTVRSYSEAVRQQLKERIPALARAQAESFGATADVDYRLGFPAVVNHEEQTSFARRVAIDTFGENRIEAAFKPRTASEDFAFFLAEQPGSYLFVGNGDTASLHSPQYNFDDAIIAPAARYWVRLVETFLA